MYRTGVKVGLFRGERTNPNIKMMDLKLREAAEEAMKRDSLYEVLLVDREGKRIGNAVGYRDDRTTGIDIIFPIWSLPT